MRVIRDISQLQKILAPARRQGQAIGFVPTMGCLHQGHLELVRRARKANDICVVSVYVNPKQFGPQEDLKTYPRDVKRDSSLLKKENVDITFFPSDNDTYPQSYLTYIDVEEVSLPLCGAFRPGHFRGVATIVAKLLNIVQPARLYLGAKDVQQVVVIKTMVRDLNFPVSVEVVPTVREQDGLAMSSRNARLFPSERKEAPVIYKALRVAQALVARGERDPAKVTGKMRAMIHKTQGKIQYVECVDLERLQTVQRLEGDIVIAVAVFFGTTRLIDNVIIRRKPGKN